MKKNIGFISDGRTSHGIYQLVLDEIKKNKQLDYKYIITGSHLSYKHGFTKNIIKDEKYKISKHFSLNYNSNKEDNHINILIYYIGEISNYLKKEKNFTVQINDPHVVKKDYEELKKIVFLVFQKI